MCPRQQGENFVVKHHVIHCIYSEIRRRKVLIEYTFSKFYTKEDILIVEIVLIGKSMGAI